MTHVPASIAEGQAIGLCWMARQTGLPEINGIRLAVAQLHPEVCAWCDYPLRELLAMLANVDHSGDAAWWRLPSSSRLRMIAEAQR